MNTFLWWDENILKRWTIAQGGIDRPEYLVDPIYKKVYEINQLFSQRPWGNIIDRSGNLSHFLPIQIRRPYQYRSIDKDWATISLDTARDINSKSKSQIVVKWSGGIDSTNALVALLQVTDPKKLVILCDHKSIDEFPEFYRVVIKDRLEQIDPFQWANWDWSSGDVCVTGDCGDCVWAIIDQSFWDNGHQYFHCSWKHWVDLQHKQRGITVDHDFIEEVCVWSGVHIRSVLDLRTWFYLNFKWQDKSLDPFWCGPPGLKRDNTYIFYDHNDEFENWTMNNLDLMGGKSFADCKMPAKRFINDFFPCQRYLTEKTKINSGWWIDSYGFRRGQKRKFLADITSKGYSPDPIAVDTSYRRHHLPSMPLYDVDQHDQWNNENQFVSKTLLEKLISK